MGHGVAQALRAVVVVTAACGVFGTGSAIAQIHDDWRLAWTLPVNRTFAEPNDAYTSTGEPVAAGSMETCGTAPTTWQIDRTFWGTITGTGGPITVSTVTTPTVDTALAIYGANLSPAFSALLACSNDGVDAAAPSAAEVTFNSVAGATYYAQIGNCAGSAPVACAGTPGTIHYTVLTNDHPSYAVSGNGPKSNIGATLEAGERADCKGLGYGATVWFTYPSPGRGSISFEISAGRHVMSVYRNGAFFDCNAATSAPAQVVVPDAREGEQFAVQIGGAVAGAAPVESWFGYGATFTPDPDKDGDGHILDCDDANPAIHPGATDIVGNGIDEDCTNGDELPRLSSVVEATTNRRGRMTKFRARRVPRGATIKLRCNRGCLRRTTVRASAAGTVNLIGALRRRDVKAGTIITVAITLPNHVGRLATVRADSRRRVSVTHGFVAS